MPKTVVDPGEELHMSKITLHVKRNDTEVNFNAEGVQEGHIGQVIEGMFGALRVNLAKELTPVAAPVPVPAQPVPTPKTVVATQNVQAAVSQPAVAPTVPKYQPNNTTIVGEPTTMEEALGEEPKDGTPTHHKTGYKVKDGVKHYKCRYRCTKCGNAGNHYIPDGVKQVDCHECQTTLDVKKATPGTQGIQPDKFLNWFVAGSQLPVSEFVYGQTKKVG
jgi:hypothetical protein